jgi:hypothetical protein
MNRNGDRPRRYGFNARWRPPTERANKYAAGFADFETAGAITRDTMTSLLPIRSIRA